MRDRWKILIGLIALAVALAAGQYAYQQYDRLVTTTEIVVPSVALPPYSLITAGDLTLRALPRPLLHEPIYTKPSELVGKVTTARLAAGQLIYRHQAVEAGQFRLADDPTLEVVSFPVQVEQAVGGQVRPGSRVNIYRAVYQTSVKTDNAITATMLITDAEYAGVEVLADSVLVVDVRAQKGEPATTVESRPTASSTSNLPGSSSASSKQQVMPVQIVTVAVPPEIARDIVRLVAETHGPVDLWLSLSPLDSGK